MARNLKYQFRGLDLRTNELYRSNGTASDCRNVRLDSNKRLIKREDFDTISPPRGTQGETGEFTDKLPYSANIIGIMPFEDHKVIATVNKNTAGTQSINAFYRWDEDTNTVTLIPFAHYTSNDDTESASYSYRQEYTMYGRIQYVNQENVLLFKGSVVDDNTIASDGTVSEEDIAQDRSLLMKYDGQMIWNTGVDAIIGNGEDIKDEGTLTNEEYVRIVPFSFDNKNRWTFGNYKTHKSETYTTGISYKLNYAETFSSANSSEKTAYFRFTTNYTLLSSDSVATRTIPALFKNTALEKSVQKGQYMYSVVYNEVLTPSLPPITKAVINWEIYKFKVEDVDYVGETVTLGEFQQYNTDTGLFEDSTSIELQSNGSTNMPYCGTHINALYTSQDYTFGYQFRGYTVVGRNAEDPYSDQLFWISTEVPSTTITTYSNDTGFLFITTRFEDMYDEDTVKLPPPKSKHFINYLGAIVMCDSDAIYFSDFSVGGNIETFTPFDNTPVGSSEFGPITGVFANETFLAVFRQRETYYITGNLFTLNYRIQSYKSTRIGCSSPKSIISFKGSGIFVSEKGIYVCAQGGRMEEVSDVIEPLFTDDILGLNLDMFNVETAIDFQKEIIYFDFATLDDPDVHYQIVYSYYHQEWFIYESLATDGGFSMINDKLYASDGQSIYVEGDTNTDSEAYYRSNFESLGSASTYKKFVKVWVSTIGIKDSFSVNIKAYKNWDFENKTTDEVKSGTSTTTDIECNLNQGSRNKSCSLELNSPEGNKMILDGYEYTVEGLSSEFKHDND